MSAPFVHTGALRSHAVELRGVSDGVSAAAQTGRGTGLGFSTYGIIGQFFAGGARSAVEETSSAIADFGGDIDRVADAVVATADLYDRTEDDNTISFQVGR